MFRMGGCGKVTQALFNPDFVVAPFRGQFPAINTAVLDPQMVIENIGPNEAPGCQLVALFEQQCSPAVDLSTPPPTPTTTHPNVIKGEKNLLFVLVWTCGRCGACRASMMVHY